MREREGDRRGVGSGCALSHLINDIKRSQLTVARARAQAKDKAHDPTDWNKSISRLAPLCQVITCVPCPYHSPTHIHTHTHTHTHSLTLSLSV